jgi:TRAP-type C4-dicarboxylate transport system permease small subunit
MIMAGVVIAVQHGSHISVVILTQKLPLLIRRYVLAAGSCIVAILYGSLAVMAWPLVEIAADEKTPILQIPGSYSMACLMFGFAMLAVMTICKLPSVWQGAASVQGDAE